MLYFCCDQRRRAAVKDHPTLNGIDFLEVVDHEEPVQAERQRKLRVHFVKPPTPPLTGITAANVHITGGVRVTDIRVDEPLVFSGDVLEVHVTPRGDYSTYTLSLVGPGGKPLEGLDPVLASVAFSFKVECPSDFDCRPQRVCPPDARPELALDYLAKDYASFRRLMLDRLSVLMPQWQERNPADLGVVLVELLAYVGDHLSYQQDAVATEAYLGTARRRVSVRRHARLVDYFMHDGCNARAWVHVRVDSANVSLGKGSQLLTRVPGLSPPLLREAAARERALAARPEFFETLEAADFFVKHNRLPFYTWGDRECCLPRGATRATLAGSYPDLRANHVLIFEEVLGPNTGEAQDADPAHRHAVRLTDAAAAKDPLGDVDITEIEWAAEDALPFALCISSTTDVQHGRRYLPEVSVALGNIVLADHGRTVSESLDPVPEDVLRPAPPGTAADRCAEAEPVRVRARYRPRLREQPLTQAATVARTAVVEGRKQRLALDPQAPAAAAFRWEMAQVLPAAYLKDPDGRRWLPRRDLLSSDAFAADFVAEVEENGQATLRFGDDQYGLRPTPRTTLTATYRVGNGARGNVGADTIVHVVSNDARITAVRNLLPARGGVEPETLEHVRQSAPHAFRVQERAVTPEDYAAAAERHSAVQRAAATVRWTGSWRTVFLTIDRLGGRPVDGPFEEELRRHLERFRMAGHDIEIDGPAHVSLEITLDVCVHADYFRGDVAAALLAALGSSTQPDGRRGLFHPDYFTFGQPVYVSRVLAAAQAVPGVRHVDVTQFRRLGDGGAGGLTEGVLRMGRLEIARLDNDPNFPERGVLRLTLKGGR